MRIERDDLSRPEVLALLSELLAGMHALSPPESVHALDVAGLRVPEVTFWTVWDDDRLLGGGDASRDTDDPVLRVFAYGSLMWDGWENGHACLRRVVADLHGYRRGFTKASVRNWGTRDAPAPTLNLAAAADGVCRGIVFEFAGASAPGVRGYLAAREGPGFELREVRARLLDGSELPVVTAIYRGRNTIEGKGPEEIAAMVVAASGTSGRCIDYVRALSERLAALGIDDPAVTGLWERLRDG